MFAETSVLRRDAVAEDYFDSIHPKKQAAIEELMKVASQVWRGATLGPRKFSARVSYDSRQHDWIILETGSQDMDRQTESNRFDYRYWQIFTRIQ